MQEQATLEYTAKDIQVLEGLEAVRVRPGMYIGSTDQRGLHHLIYEILDNAVDEAMAGFCSSVTVTLDAEGLVSVTDNGARYPGGHTSRDRQDCPGNRHDHTARRG